MDRGSGLHSMDLGFIVILYGIWISIIAINCCCAYMSYSALAWSFAGDLLVADVFGCTIRMVTVLDALVCHVLGECMWNFKVNCSHASNFCCDNSIFGI